MITFKAPVARVQQGLYTFYATSADILYFCTGNHSCKVAITIMDSLFDDMIPSFLGKAYLHLRFRDKEKVQQELERKYEGQFRNAGVVLLADIFMALAVVAVVSMLASLLYFVVA